MKYWPSGGWAFTQTGALTRADTVHTGCQKKGCEMVKKECKTVKLIITSLHNNKKLSLTNFNDFHHLTYLIH